VNDALVQKEYIACYLLASDLNCIIFKWLVLDISFVISIIPLLQECYLNLKFVNLDLGDEIPGDGPAPPRRHGYAARENGAQQQRGAGRGKIRNEPAGRSGHDRTRQFCWSANDDATRFVKCFNFVKSVVCFLIYLELKNFFCQPTYFSELFCSVS
jgi:hypothetical protein